MLVVNCNSPQRTIEKIGKLNKAKRIIATQSKLENIEANFMQVARRENQRNERALKRANR